MYTYTYTTYIISIYTYIYLIYNTTTTTTTNIYPTGENNYFIIKSLKINYKSVTNRSFYI